MKPTIFSPFLHSLPSSSRSIIPLSRSLTTSAPPPPLRSPSTSPTPRPPKRDPTTYGIPTSIPRKDWPKEQETDTSSHPLWRFFHEGESLEVPDKRKDTGGRSWTSFELRRKSFQELHQLWFVLLRERNVLLTQREEARRLRLDLKGFTAHADKLRMVQKSQARIKQVVSERRHAAYEAAEILKERGEVEEAEKLEREGRELEEVVRGAEEVGSR